MDRVVALVVSGVVVTSLLLCESLAMGFRGKRAGDMGTQGSDSVSEQYCCKKAASHCRRHNCESKTNLR